MLNNFKKGTKGITLIALVVTIIVLLILAGIAISLTVGNNGLFARAKNAANTWKEAESNEADEMSNFEKIYDETLEDLGLKESKVKINISKTPETKQAKEVLLKVTSVEGIEIYEEEKLPTMSEEEKKDIIRKIYIVVISQQSGRHLTSFEETLEVVASMNSNIQSEDDFWNMINQNFGTLDNTIKSITEQARKEGIKTCFIQNPDGEYSDEYIAKENGTYTFIVEDIFTGNKYKKSIEVSNVDNILCYVYNVDEDIYLIEKEKDKKTTFESAFVTIDGEKIDISSVIENINIGDENYSYLYDMDIIRYLFETKGGEDFVFWIKKIKSIPTRFELVKDGISYIGFLELPFPER